MVRINVSDIAWISVGAVRHSRSLPDSFLLDFILLAALVLCIFCRIFNEVCSVDYNKEVNK